MPGPDSGKLVKLTISPVEIDEVGKVTVKQDPKFEVMLNPSSYNHHYTIDYNRTEALGQIGSDLKFRAIGAEKVSFDIVLDGTGVISPGQGSPDVPSVPSRIRELNTVAYQYKGNNHEPNHVRLLWSTLIFFGRLDSMSIDYTLFKPSGEPLRAKVTLNFVGFMSKEEQALRANRSSPDLSHRVLVKEGDTLPLLCYRVYKDASYYLEVAAVNNLTNFRDLEPGVWLNFPPLR